MDGTFLSNIFNFFLDKTRSFGLKTAIGITFVAATVLIDIGLSISYNAHVSNKIGQLKSIQSLKSSYRTDTLKLAQIKELEEEIISRQHYSDFLRFDLLINSDKSYTNDQNENQSATPNTTAKKPILSFFWTFVTTNFFMLLVSPILLLLPLFPDQKMDRTGFFGWLVVIIFWAALMFLLALGTYQIPIIFDRPTINYILYFILQFTLLFTIVGVTKKKK